MRYTRVLASAALASAWLRPPWPRRRDAQPCADHADPQGRPALVPPGDRRRAEQLADGQSTNWSSVPKRKVTPPITVKLTPTQTTKLKDDRACRFLEGDFARPTPPSPGSSGSASSPTAAGRPAATLAGPPASRGTGLEKTPGPRTGRRLFLSQGSHETSAARYLAGPAGRIRAGGFPARDSGRRFRAIGVQHRHGVMLMMRRTVELEVRMHRRRRFRAIGVQHRRPSC